MRLGFALALGLTLLSGAVWYGLLGHARGVQFVSTQSLGKPDLPDFQGLSGYERELGAQFFLSDRGYLFAQVGTGLRRLVLRRGQEPLARNQRDAEGLALLPDGRFAVSFEGDHRVEVFSRKGVWQEALPVPESFSRFGRNDGLEALAISPDGALLTLPERSGAVGRDFPIFIYEGTWRQTMLPRRGAFLPVGADFGPDGRFYLLERDYLASGFRSRIRRFDWDGTQLTNERELLKTRFWRHGNLEGIAVFEERGEVFIEMVSDNNFLPFQRSELVRYLLKSP